MVQKPLKPCKHSGKATTERRNKPQPCTNKNRNPALRKLRKASKLVTIGKIEKLMSSTATSNNEHLVFVNKSQKKEKSHKSQDPSSPSTSGDLLE